MKDKFFSGNFKDFFQQILKEMSYKRLLYACCLGCLVPSNISSTTTLAVDSASSHGPRYALWKVEAASFISNALPNRMITQLLIRLYIKLFTRDV